MTCWTRGFEDRLLHLFHTTIVFVSEFINCPIAHSPGVDVSDNNLIQIIGVFHQYGAKLRRQVELE